MVDRSELFPPLLLRLIHTYTSIKRFHEGGGGGGGCILRSPFYPRLCPSSSPSFLCWSSSWVPGKRDYVHCHLQLDFWEPLVRDVTWLAASHCRQVAWTNGNAEIHICTVFGWGLMMRFWSTWSWCHHLENIYDYFLVALEKAAKGWRMQKSTAFSYIFCSVQQPGLIQSVKPFVWQS